MKRILTPTDFSECSKDAAKVAAHIASKANVQLDLLHLLNSPEFTHFSRSGQVEASEALKKAKEETLTKLAALAAELNVEGLKTELFVGLEATIQEIEKHQKQHSIDLIVVGSHGSSGFREAFLGSNTQKMLRKSKAPVLVVKALPKNLDFKNIVFASSFREDVHEAFAKILAFAKIFGAKIHLLYVNMPYNFEVSSSSFERMQSFADQYPGNDFEMHIYNAFDEESGILKFSHSNNIDLIATTTHGKSGFIQMLSPSITESLANHSSLPVLSVNLK
jgi:nucleotide-binding universal stress UspA family protein